MKIVVVWMELHIQDTTGNTIVLYADDCTAYSSAVDTNVNKSYGLSGHHCRHSPQS